MNQEEYLKIIHRQSRFIDKLLTIISKTTYLAAADKILEEIKAVPENIFEKEVQPAKERMNLTFDQEAELCGIIDIWYQKWQDHISYTDDYHRLGEAKEELKEMICKDEDE
jgi:hypothetical protein